MAFKINHLHIKSPNPRETARWYVDNLGAKIVEQIQGAGGTVAGFRLDLHGLRLNVTGFVDGQKLEQHYGMEHLAIATDDLSGVVDSLKAGSARILEQRQLRDGRRVCFFEGPDGVRLEVMEMGN